MRAADLRSKIGEARTRYLSVSPSIDGQSADSNFSAFFPQIVWLFWGIGIAQTATRTLGAVT